MDRVRREPPASSKWATCVQPREGSALRLFAFPYAGASAAIYRPWVKELPPQIELWAVHLPGREARISEPGIPSIAGMAAALAAGLRDFLDMPFAFFGHSMGALLAFELSRQLRREALPLPRLLAVSAHRAPHLPNRRPRTYDLPPDEFLAEITRLNGTPVTVLEHQELLDLLLPTLRADFEAVETYAYTPGAPLPCPIRAYGGVDDPEVSRAEIEPWREQTSGTFSVSMFPGDHFYVHAPKVAAQVGMDLVRQEVRPSFLYLDS
jgi:medium-chain acyl-[acyl-carrier-protein] hydrolase